MKWPWVLRSTLEADAEADNARERRRVGEMQDLKETVRSQRSTIAELLATAGRQDAIYERQMLASETRYADLMTSYRLLRLNGFSPPPAEPITLNSEKPDPVMAAINARAPDAKTRKMMEAQVRLDRSMDLTDPEIIARIERGTRPAEDFA